MDGSEENDDDFGTFYHVKVHPGDEDHFCMVTSEELELHTPSEDTDEDHCDVRRLVTSLHEDQTVSQVVELISQEGFDFKLRDKISFSDIISVRPEQSTVRVITRDRTVLLEMADRSLADECASDVLERLGHHLRLRQRDRMDTENSICTTDNNYIAACITNK